MATVILRTGICRLAVEQLKPVNGLQKLCKWVEDHGVRRAAVTNAPRVNAEFMISKLGLDNFFEFLVVGSECEKAKPFPEPYLKGLELLKASPEHTFVFEVCFFLLQMYLQSYLSIIVMFLNFCFPKGLTFVFYFLRILFRG